MRSPERQSSLFGPQALRGGLDRFRQTLAATPLPIKVLLIAAICVFAVPLVTILLFAALIYAPFALWSADRSVAATASVALWGVALVAALAHGADQPRYALLALPLVVAALAHVGLLGRWDVPARTAAWCLVWSLPVGITTFRVFPDDWFLGPATAWLIAFAILGWRLAKALQDSREHARRAALPRAVGAPFAVAAGVAGHAPGVPTEPGQQWQPSAAQASPHALLSQPAAEAGPYAPASAVQRGESARPTRAQSPRAETAASWPEITVEEAMAELAAMVGLTDVKSQIESLAASVEAARRRAIAGHSSDKPMQHFVFLGPPGTGKTAVARIIAKIFYAFGLLNSPALVEAQRADLVGEYLGATAIKTNELVDSALGGTLFIDEAYSLVNEGDGQGDRFGTEAVQALLKRAEDDRESLIIILAGYERQMESFLTSNPGLNSRFGVRIKFPRYSAPELLALADKAVADRGELLDSDASPVLCRVFDEVGRRQLADELGNGRFVRSLVARAGQRRDVRVMTAPGEPTSDELITLHGEDFEVAYAELTSRFRGYAETPTVESALAELDALVGLAPVKQQVREIVAQLQVARLREQQGLASHWRARHFVFTGPPGTGKTTVARIIGRIFAALGLLVRPEVVEAHRADLVGEHLGSTAIKTNKLIDAAMGGVLFIDEAYALHNEAYAGGDAFGSEAVSTLLKRAEDDRERLVIVLAGYTDHMARLLRSNPGLASRFSTRIAFPSYTVAELCEIAQVVACHAGDSVAPDAMAVLESIFARACEQRRIDELGNGRFARSIYERASAARDVRVADRGEHASAADLTTVTAADVTAAYQQLAG